jgi:starch phosphorylase
MSAQPPIDVAYFSMEMMLESDIPTYAGGLGVLAGDLLRSCADMHVPVVGVSLVYSGDTFIQLINLDGSQSFYRSDWQKLDQLQKLPTRIEMEIGGMPVIVGCWRYDIVGADGFVVPVYLLDTNFVDNPQWIRDFTINLYRSGGDIRICQELILGIGGVKMLRALGYRNIKTFHLNEGHTAFVPLELLAENNYQEAVVKKMCVFTTHTPVPEGHDKFGYDQAWHYGRKYLPWHIRRLAGDDCLNMTRLALNLSRTSFAVSEKHQSTSERLFPGFKFDYVTNGIHHRTWTAPTIQNLFDQYLPGWFIEPDQLISAPEVLPDDALWAHHQDAKAKLIRYVNTHLTAISSPDELHNPLDGRLFDVNTLTISLARRPVAYKRPLLLYQDIERFVRLGAGKLQIIQCGKSHPEDDVSQEFVRQIVTLSKRFKDVLRISFLRNYSPKLARVLVSGSDLWLNTPRRPLEASGTSGMKAAINGCLNFSVQDGWWIEALRTNPLAGWPLGPAGDCPNEQDCDAVDANDMYTQLEQEIIPLYYDHRPEWIARMKQAITLGAYFNTHRVVREYQAKAWNQRT